MASGHASRDEDAQEDAEAPPADKVRDWDIVAGAQSLDTHPQLIVKKSPFVLKDKTDWAMEAVPKQTSTKVPAIIIKNIKYVERAFHM